MKIVVFCLKIHWDTCVTWAQSINVKQHCRYKRHTFLQNSQHTDSMPFGENGLSVTTWFYPYHWVVSKSISETICLHNKIISSKDTSLYKICTLLCVFQDYGCFAQQDVNTMVSFYQTITRSVLISDATLATNLGMTSMVTSSLSRCPWSVLVEVQPTPTNLIQTTHVARRVISVELPVRSWYQSHNDTIAVPCLTIST